MIIKTKNGYQVMSKDNRSLSKDNLTLPKAKEIQKTLDWLAEARKRKWYRPFKFMRR